MIGAAVVGVALLTACAADIDNRPLTEGLLITGAYAMGVVESVSITTSTFPLRSQEEIGQGGGLSGSTRNFVSAISVAVYTATLNNRLNQTVPQQVRAAALAAGLPEGSLPALYAALRGTGSYDMVAGINNGIKTAVAEPYRVAFKNAAATVFLVSLAFSGSALILSFFTTNNDKSTENYVAGGLHGRGEEKDYQKEMEAERTASQSH
jgi:type IV secretory pathway VirB2 component (pilin)